MTPERKERILKTALYRQLDLTVVLENVHDPHNIGAVLRTCDSVGIHDVVVLYTDERLVREGIKIGINANSGARKWLDIHYFTKLADCKEFLNRKGLRILTTAIGSSSNSIYKTDFLHPTAIVFGNENRGISPEMQAISDGNILVPQVGMVKSLNISVACAVTLYEIHRQRSVNGYYSNKGDLGAEKRVLFEKYVNRHQEKIKSPEIIDYNLEETENSASSI